jgi:hypothetical protein
VVAVRGTKRPLSPQPPVVSAKKIRRIVQENEKWDNVMNEQRVTEGELRRS